MSVPLYFLKKKGERGARAILMYGIMPLIGTAICVVLWINIAITAKIIGLIWLAIGIIILTIKTKGFRKLPPELTLE